MKFVPLHSLTRAEPTLQIAGAAEGGGTTF